MRVHLSPSAFLFISALAVIACGGESETGDGGGGSGGLTGTGGAVISDGGAFVGGNAAGGASSGGASSGGAALNGGASAGGRDNSGGAGVGGGAAGGQSSGGAASGGSDTGEDVLCAAPLIGWAAVEGDGVATTDGAGDIEPVRPSTAQELMDWASDGEPRVIEIEGTFDVPRLQIASNKTLIGVGTDATINGGVRIRGSGSSPVSNVIVRNLHINGASSNVDGDAFQIYFAHHVWVDHCDVYDGPDGNLDMTHAVNWVTVSWTVFRYTDAYRPAPGETGDHRFSTLIGHSDSNEGEDRGRLKVTFHHNHWSEGVIERMPRVRFGQVHSFNNYFSSEDTNYCIRAGKEAHILSEGNYFLNQRRTHEFNNASDEASAHITAQDNLYEGGQGMDALMGGGTPYEGEYVVEVEDADSVPERVEECVGPR